MSERRASRYARWRQRAAERRATDVAWRLAVLAVGSAVVAAGLVMLVVPGPGWAAIFLGLAILATEYAWAHRLLQRARNVAVAAAARTRSRRWLALVLGAVVVVALVAAGVWLWQVQPTLPWSS